MRKLDKMLHGKRVFEWGMVGSSMALLANVNRDPKRRRAPFDTAHFVPSDLRKLFRRRRRPSGGVAMTPKTLHALKPLFGPEKPEQRALRERALRERKVDNGP